jgi:tetratricopeptide (TPR) repeat protein
MTMKTLKLTAVLLLGITLGISCSIVFGAYRLWALHERDFLIQGKAAIPNVHLPSSDADLKERLDLYAKRADDIEHLLSVLLAISTVYAIALGVNAYAQLKESSAKMEKLTDSMTHDAEKTKSEILQIFPIFDGIDIQITAIMSHLLDLLPRIDIAQKKYADLTPEQREAVRYYEQSIAATEIFNMRPFAEKRSGIYHGLGNFYALRFVGENRTDNESLQRCLFYLGKAIALDPKNIAALNDRAYVALRIYATENYEEARRFFELSRQADPEQQRALYNLSWIYHKQGDFTTSINLATEALNVGKWQMSKETARISDIYYHRACSFARRDGLRSGNKRFEATLDDLQQVLSNTATDWPSILKSFRKDLQTGEDLHEVSGSSSRAKKVFADFEAKG